MNEYDLATISGRFDVTEDLTPTKSENTYHTYLADVNCDKPIRVVLKELDEKRAGVYDKLCKKWHPNVASTYEIIPLAEPICPEDGPSFLAVTECVLGISLKDYVRKNGPLDPKTACSFTKQICQGMQFVHSLDIIHKDIKPENIIVTSNRKSEDGYPLVKLIDFGISEGYNRKREYATEVGGTMGYRAPEANDYVADKTSDVFSVGCVLNYMLCGHDPSVQKYHGKMSLETVIGKCTAWDPSYRYASMKQLETEMNHVLQGGTTGKLSILSSIPGYRTGTLWKKIVATIYYGSLLLFIPIFFSMNVLAGVVGILSYIIVPWIFVLDLFHWEERYPRWLIKNKRLLFILRFILCIICAYAPTFVM